MSIIPTHGDLIPQPDAPDYDVLVDATLTVLRTNTAVIYSVTYAQWANWCEGLGIDPLHINSSTVRAFLIDQRTTRTTRKNKLAALRKLAWMLMTLAPAEPRYKVAYDVLKVMPVPDDNLSANERPRVALSPAEADRAMRCWDEPNHRHKRNRALICVLLATGIRRAEAAAMRWEHVDFANGTIYIPHGKGDKARDVAVYGDEALRALAAWQQAQGAGRVWVFCRVNKAGRVLDDAPLLPSSVWRVVRETERRAGLDRFSSHDARRSLLTELLETGSPLTDAQAQAGHADGSTTMKYAQATDARARRRKGKIRYG